MIVEGRQVDHRHGHGADRRPGGAGGKIAGVVRGVKADHHRGIGTTEEKIAAVVHETEGDSEVILPAAHCPRRHLVAVSVRDEMATATSREDEVIKNVPAAVAVTVEADHDLLPETPIGREGSNHRMH